MEVTVWSRVKHTSAALRAGHYERQQCDKCQRWISKNAMVRHLVACEHGEVAAKLPQGHRICGLNGCTRIRPASARCCYACEEKSPELLEVEARLSRI